MSGRQDSDQDTVHLLARVRDDDRLALNSLLERVMPRIEGWVRQTRGRAVAGKFDTLDCSQDIALNLIQYLPSVDIRDSDTLHALLYRMIVNSIKNKHKYLMARRRRLTQERPLGSASISLDVAATSGSPSAALIREERQAWIRFCLALLTEDEQELIFRHHYDGESFVTISARLGQTPDAMRMRFNRAMTRLSALVARMRSGGAATVAADFEREPEQ